MSIVLTINYQQLIAFGTFCELNAKGIFHWINLLRTRNGEIEFKDTVLPELDLIVLGATSSKCFNE